MSKSKRSLPTKQKVVWPKGKAVDKFKKQLLAVTDQVLQGRVLAVDPASGGTSNPGWAMFYKGEYQASGELDIMDKKKSVQQRLNDLLSIVEIGFSNPPPDVLVIEQIRGSRAHVYLKWSVGVVVAGVRSSVMLECPINLWKAIVPEDYEKTDEADATYIGMAIVRLAKELCDE